MIQCDSCNEGVSVRSVTSQTTCKPGLIAQYKLLASENGSLVLCSVSMTAIIHYHFVLCPILIMYNFLEI